MDELSNRLAEILNDPESMNRVRQMAENILSENKEKKEESSEIDMPDMAQIGQIMGIMSKLKETSRDSRTELLMALRPHLSEPRREKVDTAVKLMRLIEILPLIKESGII